MNFDEYLLKILGAQSPTGVELDYLVSSDLLDDGSVIEAVEYPKIWPAAQFGKSIPEYKGVGYMSELFIIHPNMSCRSDDILSVILSVYDYTDEDIKKYIEGLNSFAVDEAFANDFFQKLSASIVGLKSVKSYKNDDCVLSLIFAEDGKGATGKFVQFNVTYFRGGYKLNTSVNQPTKLLNYFQWAEANNIAPRQDISLDKILDSLDDESGRNSTAYATPSRWPVDVFGDLIPAYSGSGVLYRLEVTTPKNNKAPTGALIVSLYVWDYNLKDIEQYVRALLDFGYYELRPEEYNSQEKSLAAERELLHVFTFPGFKCFISPINTGQESYLQITLRYEGRYQNFIAEK